MVYFITILKFLHKLSSCIVVLTAKQQKNNKLAKIFEIGGIVVSIYCR
jgi:hypothetical protein